jgi:hypothetical protein
MLLFHVKLVPTKLIELELTKLSPVRERDKYVIICINIGRIN